MTSAPPVASPGRLALAPVAPIAALAGAALLAVGSEC